MSKLFFAGNILLPFIAWTILPFNFEYILIENVFGEYITPIDKHI